MHLATGSCVWPAFITSTCMTLPRFYLPFICFVLLVILGKKPQVYISLVLSDNINKSGSKMWMGYYLKVIWLNMAIFFQQKSFIFLRVGSLIWLWLAQYRLKQKTKSIRQFGTKNVFIKSLF